MGIKIKANTKASESIKLYNHIASYMFEQQYDEMKNNSKIKEALEKAQDALIEIIKSK